MLTVEPTTDREFILTEAKRPGNFRRMTEWLDNPITPEQAFAVPGNQYFRILDGTESRGFICFSPEINQIWSIHTALRTHGLRTVTAVNRSIDMLRESKPVNAVVAYFPQNFVDVEKAALRCGFKHSPELIVVVPGAKIPLTVMLRILNAKPQTT